MIKEFEKKAMKNNEHNILSVFFNILKTGIQVPVLYFFLPFLKLINGWCVECGNMETF